METQELKRIIEALIFAADEPLSDERIAETLDLNNGFDLGILIDELNREYQESNRAFTIRKVAGGYQIVTQQQFSNWIRKLFLGRQKTRLSHAALETLALIAFKQPISRVDIAQIRGVNSDAVIGTLLERKLITISGRSETVGRPLLYSTTPEFLKYFGINDIADLPKPREIEELFSKEGMPEELLQALSQTDAQLSLPINTDDEMPAAEETESKIAASNPLVSSPSPATETPSVIDALNETAEVEPVSHSAVIEAPIENQGSAAADSTPVMALENSAIDINENALSQLENTGQIEASPPPLNENEIAWISLDSDANNPAEHFTGTELSVDDLAETSSDLSAFAGVTEVISDTLVTAEPSMTNANSEAEAKASFIEAMTEDLTAGFAQTDEVSNGRDNFVQETLVVAVDEIIEMAVNIPSAAVQVIEMNEVGFSDEELIPPELAADSAEEVDGWLAEESSREEIAEPDFLRKTENFFLEDVRKPAADSVIRMEPIVVSTQTLSSITGEIYQKLDETASASQNNLETQTDSSKNLPRAASTVLGDFPETNEVEIAPSQQPEHITIANLETPVIGDSLNETPPENFEATKVTRGVDEILTATVSEVAAEQTVVSEEPAAIASAESAMTPTALADFDLDAESSVSSLHAAATAAPPENFNVNTGKPVIIENEEDRSASFRERMTGWIKRALDKFLTLIGAKV